MSQFPPPQFPQQPQFQGYQPPKPPPAKKAIDPKLARLLIGLAASGALALVLCSGVIFFAVFRGSISQSVTGDNRDSVKDYTARRLPRKGDPILSEGDLIDAGQLRGISLALLNYELNFKRFPAPTAITSDGEKKLSWRASILPFVEAGDVMERIDWNKRWDESTNLAISQNAPKFFASPPILSTSPGQTHIYLIVDSDAERNATTCCEEGKYRKITDILDGNSNTAILISVPDRPHNWLEPGNITIADSYAAIQRLGGAVVALVDGHAVFVKPSIPVEEWKLLTLANDNWEFDRDYIVPITRR